MSETEKADQVEKIEKVETGVKGLDILTHGGIPKGRTTLITGRSGTGKTILALQIACYLASVGRKTIFVAPIFPMRSTSEGSPQGLSMRSSRRSVRPGRS